MPRFRRSGSGRRPSFELARFIYLAMTTMPMTMVKRRYSNVDTRKRETTFRDIERKMAANPPDGYSLVSCNWGKRKAKFVSASGSLKFVAF